MLKYLHRHHITIGGDVKKLLTIRPDSPRWFVLLVFGGSCALFWLFHIWWVVQIGSYRWFDWLEMRDPERYNKFLEYQTAEDEAIHDLTVARRKKAEG